MVRDAIRFPMPGRRRDEGPHAVLRLTRTLLAGVLMVGLLVVSAPGARAAGPTPPPTPPSGTAPVWHSPSGMSATADTPAASAASWVVGQGNAFETCAAPSTAQMQAWLASPYRGVGVYIGGENRGCAQPNLTSGWVSTVTGLGWTLLPLYVGLQAPCSGVGTPISLNTTTAASQGASAATDAIAKMTSLGIPSSRPIYFDMENYDTTNAGCVASVKAFTDAWTSTLQGKGWVSGLYGSSSSMITNLVAWRGTSYHEPTEIWFARWNNSATLDDSTVPVDAWSGHRVHQFTGGHNESYGGVTLNIDSDVTSVSSIVAITPTRVWDSRTPTIGTNNVALSIAGVAGIPTTATAAVLSIEVVAPTAAGALIVAPYQSGSAIDEQQFTKGQYISTTVVVPLNQRSIQFRLTAGNARIIVNALGYLTPTGGNNLTAMTPTRVWDSRTPTIGTNNVALSIAGVAGIPTTATAAVLSIEVVAPTAAGALIVAPYQSGSAIDEQQFTKGQYISTTVVVPLNQRSIQFRLTAGNARIIVNALGYLTPTGGNNLTAMTPTRVWDSRTPTIGTNNVALSIAGVAGIPTTATAAVLSIEVVAPTAAGALIVAPYQSGSAIDEQQFTKGQYISTTVVVPLNQRSIQFRLTAGNARIIVNALAFVN
jgi:multisubunit Na+/H+ antiporter MnhG subunit